MYKADTLVVYVPSHDGEYNRQPELGTVKDYINGRYTIAPLYSSRSQSHQRIERTDIDEKYVAAVGEAQDVLKLVTHLNNMWLKCRDVMYSAENALQADPEHPVYKRLRATKEYHIN